MAYVPEGSRNIGISGNEQEDGLAAEHRIITDNLGRLVVIIAGGAGSYPYNPETDDDDIPIGEVRETVIAILYAKDPTGNMERVLTDGAGKIQTTATVIAPGAYNPQTDDCNIAIGESHESNVCLLYGLSTTPAPDIWQCLKTDDNGRLQIADGGGSITVDGTFWQVTQPVSGTFWQVTQPISAAALPLPAGASTSAIQTTMDTSLNNIETDAAAIEVLITAGNVDLAAIEVLLTAGNVDLAAIEALQITIDASLNEIEDATENLEEALASVATDYLLIGDAGSIINLDAAGHPQVDVITMPVVAVTGTFWQATQPVSIATMPTTNTRIMDGDGATLADVVTLVSVLLPDIDGLNALITASAVYGYVNNDTCIPIRSPFAISDTVPNLDAKALLGTHSLLSARKDVDTTIGLTCRDGMPASTTLANQHGLDACSVLYGRSGANAIIIDARPATSISDPDLDGLNLFGVHALMSGRIDVDTTIGLLADAAGHLQIDVITAPTTAVTGTFWQVTQPVSGTFWQATQPISAAALPLPAGAATEASLQGCETALQIMDDWDSGDRCKVEIDQVDAVYNPETDDGQIPDGEVHDSVIAVLYAYNTSATDLKRVLVNDSGALMVYTP